MPNKNNDVALPKSILITGASGFIGSFLVEEALQRGYMVWAGVRPSSDKTYLQDARIRFIDLHYAQPECLAKQLQEHAAKYGAWEYVVHNAGLTKALQKKSFYQVNYLFTKHLVDALEVSGCVPRKFVLMSSFSLTCTQTTYGDSKQQAEQYLLQKKDFPSIILRPTGVYGPREKDYFMMMQTLCKGLDVRVGWKPQLLSFVYVLDLVQAVYLALNSNYTQCVYAVSDGQVYSSVVYTQLLKKHLQIKRVLPVVVPVSVLYLVSWCAEKLGILTKKASTLNTDKFKIMKHRDWTCNSSKAQNQLNYRPQYNLEEGIKASVKWYRENHWL